MTQTLTIELSGTAEAIEKKCRYIESKISECRNAGQTIRVPTRYRGTDLFRFHIQGDDIGDLEERLRTYLAIYDDKLILVS